MSALREVAATDGRAPITVLHVDDDRSLVDLTAELLQRHHEGFAVRTATDPRDVLDAGIGDVDCVVSDYDMPGIDGVEFLERVRRDHPSLPFILFTGKGSEAVASEAISAGVTDYLQKATGTEQYELLCQRIENAVARRRAQTNYRELFEKTPVGLTIHDPDTGTITDANGTFAGMLGYDREELIGTHPGDLSPDGSPFTHENATQLVRRAAEDGTQAFEWQDETSDGETVWVEVTLERTSIDGRQRVLAVVQDVTRRKERKQTLEHEKGQFEAIFEHSNDAIFVLDPASDEILDANQRAEELLGYDREELVTSVAISDVHPDHVEEIRAFFERVREEGAGWTDEYCCVTRSGNEREVEISAAPFEREGRHCLVANVRDVTERRERERDLERHNERLEEFASVVSHDLRNPLQVAKGRVTLAQEECDSDHIGDVATALDRMDSLLEDLLTLARHGTRSNEAEALELAELVEGCWRTVETADATLDVDADMTVRADRSRLKQLVENLVHNAVQHGSEDVTVRVGALADGFYVADDGTGIPPDERDRVFDRGYTTAEEGTGFGLRIVKRVADAHDWEIDIVDSASGGARFEFTNVDRPE